MAIKKVKLKSGAVRYRVTVNAGLVAGKRKNIVRNVQSMQKARLLESKLKLDVANGLYDENDTTPPVHTFSDLYNQWWPIYVQAVEGSTAYKTKQLFHNHLIPMFGSKTLTAIKTGSIQSAVSQWRETTTKAYKERFIYLKKILSFAVKMQYIEKNPADGVELPRGVRSGKSPVYWDNKQVARFLTCIDPNNDPEKYTMFLLMVSTGIRREELCALNVPDVNFKTSTLSINKAYATGLNGKESIKGTKSTAGMRTIPLTPKVTIQLKKWVALLDTGKIISIRDDRPLFPSPQHFEKRLGINRPNKWLKDIIEANHLTPRITLHGLRKSFVTNMIRSGVDVSTVQRLAGHSTPDVTLRIYAGMNQSDAREGIDKLAEYMEQVTF